MIDRTTLLIRERAEHHRREHERRYARRNRLHRLDGLLNQLELLNLRDETAAPSGVAREVYRMAREDHHPLLRRPLRAVSITQWMDTLYDLQDSLLFSSEEDSLN
jgi:hypothetical protein